MTDLSPHLPVRDVDERPHQRIDEASSGQWIWLGCWLLLAAIPLIAMRYNGWLFFLLLACVFIAAWGWKGTSNGPGYMVIRDLILSYRIRRRGGRVKIGEHQSDSPVVQRRRQREPIRLALTGIRLNPDTKEYLGTLFNPRAWSDTAHIACDSWPGITGTAEERLQAENDLLNVAKRVAALVPYPIGYAQIFRRRPINMVPVLDGRVRDNHISVTLPESTDDPVAHRLARRNAAIDDAVMEFSPDITQTFALTAPRSSSWPRDLTTHKLTKRELQRTPILRLVKEMVNGLAQEGVVNPTPVNLRSMRRHVLTSWMIDGVQHKLNQQANEEAARREAGHPPDPLDGDDPWPHGTMTVHRNYMSITLDREDGTTETSLHRVMKLSHYQHKRFKPGDLVGLFYAKDLGPAHKTGLCISLVGKITSAKRESGWLTRHIVLREGFRRVRYGKSEMYESLEERTARGNLLRRQDLLFLRGGYVLKHNVYAVVSATTLDDLEDACEAIEAEARIHVRFKWVTQEARQVRSLFAALLGIP